MAQAKAFFTLSELAERWGISHTSVLNLVYKGDLLAVDVSTNPRKRSRFIVPADALEAFEDSRATEPPERPVTKHRRVRLPAGSTIEFFD